MKVTIETSLEEIQGALDNFNSIAEDLKGIRKIEVFLACNDMLILMERLQRAAGSSK